MLGILYLLFFLAGGVFLTRMLLPRRKPVLRVYLGLSLGLFLMMWLPVLWAYAVRFSYAAHGLAAGSLVVLCVLGWVCRDQTKPAPMDEQQKKLLLALAVMVIPLGVVSGYLQYTHSIRLAADGSYHVGQSTYGDLSLHLAICTSIVNAKFPLENSLMLGATMAYPYLSDSVASTFYLFGMPLNTSMAFTGTLMMLLTYAGYGLLADQLCRRKGARWLAFFLLFLNGGLGFFFTLSGRVEDGVTTTFWDNLRTVMQGYYKTPTNQPDPNNLRWSNIVVDLLIPQRGLLGGWTMLMPCLNLLLPPLCRGEKHETRALVLLGVMAGGLPLLHTHSYLALVLLSLGSCLSCVFRDGDRADLWQRFRPWRLYGAIAAALSLPQLLCFTFVQATESNHFLRFQFNWCNNRGGRGLVDPYFFFYIKNVGFPYLLILLALLKRKPRELEAPGAAEEAAAVRQYRLIACGAFLIYGIAEFILFQPNEYDNNKLLYVWFALCLPMAADYAVEIWQRLKGLAGRRVIAGLFLFCCFFGPALTVAREWVSDYQAYSRSDVETAEFIKENTPEHSVWLTGNEHLNPVSSLAGRTILCSSESYLYYHGFDTWPRRLEIAAFFENPADNLSLLKEYQVEYIFVSAYERSASWFTLNEGALEALFPLIYEDEGGQHRIFQVPEEYRQ